MSFDLHDYPLWPIFLVGVVLMLACGEIGHRVGRRIGVRGGDDIGTLEGAILGLLALMIGFTFAMALTLYEKRRDAVLLEANAIGTAALRARLLPAPHNAEMLKLLRDYIQIRLDVTQHVPSPAELAAAVERSNAIQETLWQKAKVLAAKENAMVPTGLFIQSLNETFDAQEHRLTVLRYRVPDEVLLALYGVAAIASAFAGYASGLKAKRWRIPVYVMSVLVAAVILLIQDLESPATGFITIDQKPMISTAAGMAAYNE